MQHICQHATYLCQYATYVDMQLVYVDMQPIYVTCNMQRFYVGMQLFDIELSPLPKKSKGNLGLHSVRLSVCLTVRQSCK
jgi:hypothetical protein